MFNTIGNIVLSIIRFLSLKWMPGFLRFACYGLAGVACGLMLVFMTLLNAFGFLGDNPDVCATCHVMRSHYVTWSKSSHARDATCNDCHVPNQNLAKKFAQKQKSGLWDMYIFLTRQEPQVIRLSENYKEIVRENCLRCHPRQTQTMALYNQTDRFCGDCHRETVHGRIDALSSTPYARYPGIINLQN